MPIKNYKGAGKGRVRRDRVFFFFSPSLCLDTTMFIWPSFCLTWWDLLCQFLNTLRQGAPVNINERHPWANTRGSDKQRLSSQSLSILIFWPAVNRLSRLPQGRKGKKKGIFCSIETHCHANTWWWRFWQRIARVCSPMNEFPTWVWMFA